GSTAKSELPRPPFAYTLSPALRAQLAQASISARQAVETTVHAYSRAGKLPPLKPNKRGGKPRPAVKKLDGDMLGDWRIAIEDIPGEVEEWRVLFTPNSAKRRIDVHAAGLWSVIYKRFRASSSRS
ncbi:MAG: hypothetical protein ACOYOB_18805, partial [Myxococcota bacterium]